MSSRKFPDVAQVRQLPAHLVMAIPPEWEDHNGHVNVQYYLGLYELGGYEVLAEVGIDIAVLETLGCGMFDLEHHIHFRSEVLVGQQVSSYNRILQASEKRFHGMYFIINDTLDRLACTIEYVTAGVDLRERRTAPFPDSVYQGVLRQLERHERLDWDAPVCGSMQI